MSKDIDAVSESAKNIPAFYYTVAEHNILLEPSVKTEIVEQPTIFPMPHAPEWCLGMISLRGKIIPVLDMAYMLNQTRSANTKWLLVLESSPLPLIAIQVDNLPARTSYKEDQVATIANQIHAYWLPEFITIENNFSLFKADHRALFQRLINENLELQNQKEETNNKKELSGDDV